MLRNATVAIAFALFALAGSSWSANEEASPLTHAIVKGVDATAGTVTLDHEDIPGVMMAMTMAFKVSDPALLTEVSVGQAVDFRLRKDGDGDYVVTEIKPAEQRATGEGAHGGGMSCCEPCKGAGCGDAHMHHRMTGDGHHKMMQP